MANENKTAKEDLNELVDVRLFKDSDRYKDDVFVAVNGESVLIKRGEKVKVKRKFANVIENSMTQEGKLADYINEQTSARAKAESAGIL